MPVTSVKLQPLQHPLPMAASRKQSGTSAKKVVVATSKGAKEKETLLSPGKMKVASKAKQLKSMVSPAPTKGKKAKESSSSRSQELLSASEEEGSMSDMLPDEFSEQDLDFDDSEDEAANNLDSSSEESESEGALNNAAIKQFEKSKERAKSVPSTKKHRHVIQKEEDDDASSSNEASDSDMDDWMGSEDDDEDGSSNEKSGSRGGMLDVEKKAKKEEKRQKEEDAAAEAEFAADAADHARIALPSARDLLEEQEGPPDLAAILERIKEVSAVLVNFKSLGTPGVARSDYVEQFLQDLALYYGYNPELLSYFYDLFPPAELVEFLEANEAPRPITIRANTLKTRRRDLAATLTARGVSLDPLSTWSKTGLQIYESPVPIGATPEYLAGHYMIQGAASFLPVIALQPQQGERCLDMAAAPGGKCAYMSAMMKNAGTVVANDSNKARLVGLMANIARLGCSNVITVNMDGRDIPTVIKGFDRVLLDAPCSGLGVISKDPAIKTRKSKKDIYIASTLQKELLLSAIDCCDHSSKTGGYVVYSTCSVAPHENEDVIQYALNTRNVKIVDSGLEFGVDGMTRWREKRYHPTMNKSRRFYPHTHNMDGFFVCKLQKLGAEKKEKTKDVPSAERLPASELGKRTFSQIEDEPTVNVASNIVVNKTASGGVTLTFGAEGTGNGKATIPGKHQKTGSASTPSQPKSSKKGNGKKKKARKPNASAAAAADH